MRRLILFLSLVLSPAVLSAQQYDPFWTLTLFGGGSSYCDENGCFGPNGVAFGGSFGRRVTPRISMEGEFTFACTWEDLTSQFDPDSGEDYIAELERERIWTGGSVLIQLGDLQNRSHFYILVGAVGAREVRKEVPPEGIPAPPDEKTGVRFGVSTGIGYNWWFAENWGIRPELRFYAVFGDDLSALRYTGGLMRRF